MRKQAECKVSIFIISVFLFLAGLGMNFRNVYAGELIKTVNLKNGEAVRDCIAKSEDRIFYQIDITENGYFTVTVKRDDSVYSSSSFCYLTIYDTNFNKIIGYFVDNNLTTVKLPMAPGRYTAEVSCQYYGRNVPYLISYQFVKSNSWEIENNDTINRATPISAGTVISGISHVRYETDWYKIQLPAESTIQLTLERDPESTVASSSQSVYIYDQTGSRDILTSGKPLKLHKAGWYSISVYTYNGHYQYRMKIDVTPEKPSTPVVTVDTPKLKTLTNTANGLQLSWEKSSGATLYYVYRKTSSTAWKRIASTTALTYQDTAVNKKNGTLYTYTVRAYKSGTLSGYQSGISSVRIMPVKLSSVTAGTKSAVIKWQKNAKASGYQIQYSTDSNFKSGNKTINLTSGSRVSYTLKKLVSKKTYYFRVRPYKVVNGKKLYGTMSATRKIKVK